MIRRTHICKKCGKLERVLKELSGKKKHCDVLMEPLTHEQGYLAVRLESTKRIAWFEKGGYLLKGPSRRKRWLPALTEEQIKEAIWQEANHLKKKPKSYGPGAYRELLKLVLSLKIPDD